MNRTQAREPSRVLQTLFQVGAGALVSGCATGPNERAVVSLDVPRAVEPRFGAREHWIPQSRWQVDDDEEGGLDFDDVGVGARFYAPPGIDGGSEKAGILRVEGEMGVEDGPEDVRKAVESRFPGAVIKEVEQETWKGQSVTEVELTDKDGRHFEVLLSPRGEILSVEEKKGLPWIGGELALGFAMRGERDIYKGIGTELEPSPFFMYENGPLEILAYDGIDAWFRLLGNDWLSLKASGSILLEEGYDPADSDYFEGMDEISTLYYAGLQLEATRGNWETRLEFQQDISGEHDGQEVELSLFYTKVWSGFELRPELNLTWMSSDAVDYFYGVSGEEARPDRPAYSPGSSFEVGIGMLVQWPITKSFTAVALFEVSAVGGEIKGSPLVDSDYEIEGALGVMYSF
jgi:outer membrane scaffolding protein for murein synthesis (MipA/OmpV family)